MMMNITAMALALPILLAGLDVVTSAGFRVKAPVGGNAVVRCPYERGSERFPKYFSRGRPGERITVVSTYRYPKYHPSDDRFSLEDDQERRQFNVTIRNLTVDDAGVYWCGVDWWGPDQPKEVNLDVVQEIPQTQNASLPLPIPTGHPLLTHNTPVTDQSVYLGVSMAVVVLLCGIMTAIFLLIKKNYAKRGTDSTQPRTCTQSNRETCICEDIVPTNDCTSEPSHSPETPRPSAKSRVPHPESTIYTVITLPRTPPDDATPSPSADSASLHYATINTVGGSHVVKETSAEKSHDVYAIISTKKTPLKV